MQKSDTLILKIKIIMVLTERKVQCKKIRDISAINIHDDNVQN